MDRQAEANRGILDKYLRQYAEPETAAFDPPVESGRWSNVLVIPARNESPALLRTPPPCGGRSLMILVINESRSSTAEVSLSNQALAATVRASFQPQWQSAAGFSGFELSLWRDDYASRDVLVVDRFKEGRKLPAKGGVGHARKIGADLATSLIYRGCVTSPWIHCTDADVRLPASYFICSDADVFLEPGTAALVYPFLHEARQIEADNQAVMLATQLYELSLRYYVAGMKFARSPYAFHTIGSTIAVKATHYAKVRGFPKREAAEDFYLLNKLAKTGSVVALRATPDCEPISIEARRSNRVPFGTGAAVGRIVSMTDPMSAFRFYDPAIFALMRHWLESWPAIWRSQTHDLSDAILTGSFEHARGRALLAGLRKIETKRALDHAFRQSSDRAQFIRQMHIWFDAFRSLKLIHTLRDHDFPSVAYARLAADGLFSELLAQDSELRAFYEQFQSRLAVGGPLQASSAGYQEPQATHDRPVAACKASSPADKPPFGSFLA